MEEEICKFLVFIFEASSFWICMFEAEIDCLVFVSFLLKIMPRCSVL